MAKKSTREISEINIEQPLFGNIFKKLNEVLNIPDRDYVDSGLAVKEESSVVNQSSVSRWNSGINNPSKKQMKEIIRIMKTKIQPLNLVSFRKMIEDQLNQKYSDYKINSEVSDIEFVENLLIFANEKQSSFKKVYKKELDDALKSKGRFSNHNLYNFEFECYKQTEGKNDILIDFLIQTINTCQDPIIVYNAYILLAVKFEFENYEEVKKIIKEGMVDKDKTLKYVGAETANKILEYKEKNMKKEIK